MIVTSSPRLTCGRCRTRLREATPFLAQRSQACQIRMRNSVAPWTTKIWREEKTPVLQRGLERGKDPELVQIVDNPLYGFECLTRPEQLSTRDS